MLIQLRLLFDFGLVALIWLVQLTIYPSFSFFSATELDAWHSEYVQNISFVVIPLMFGQVILSALIAFQKRSTYTIGSLLLVLLVWVLTFAIFVPLHDQIASGNYTEETLKNLVTKNWLRTAVWNFIFIWGIIDYRNRTTPA
ncbi:hypothetical protein [Maribacter halichondriae]|uniref:hypothetical protein n=1 Tax=Maribacter halichondriae TaxID=2980554 RepID=UPI002358C0E2|nr:hypothetical protein [Maribacter sp. Hal144]